MSDQQPSPKLTGFGIGNYRSFDKDGFVLQDFKKMNVLIGKNNSGKSNVLRYFCIETIEECAVYNCGIQRDYRCS